MQSESATSARLVPHRQAIAVALGTSRVADALAELPRLVGVADLVELRLDLFEESYNLEQLLAARGTLPVVVTLRAADQGGRCTDPPAARLELLRRAASLGAEYVDLEWDAATPAALAALRAEGALVIASRHCFSHVPPDFAGTWWDSVAATGADVVKAVGFAHDVRDCMAVVQGLRRADRPAVAIAMGEDGLPSRIVTLREPTCLLTYAAPPSAAGTAPGQVSVGEMRDVYQAARIGATTRVYGLLSPHPEPALAACHNRWFAEAGVDGVAVPFPCAADAAGVVQAFRALPVVGWHVHGAPLQAQVGDAVDALDTSAQRQGKVNSISRDSHGQLVGGWIESPEEQFERWTGQSPPR